MRPDVASRGASRGWSNANSRKSDPAEMQQGLGRTRTSNSIRASSSLSFASSAAALRKWALSQSGLSSTHFSASWSAWLTLLSLRNEALRLE